MPRLLYSTTSPYSAKVRMAAAWLELPIEAVTVNTSEEPTDLIGNNPLGKIPTLVLDDGSALFDSRVIMQELDRMSFDVYETQERIEANERPIVVITSNNEKELPDAFLRRCFFHYIKFPDRDTMADIIEVHFPGIQKALVKKAMDVFYELRDVPGLKKKPSTSELLDWLKLLLNEDMPLDVLQDANPNAAIPPLHGALLKNEQDVMMFERLAFMARRQQ